MKLFKKKKLKKSLLIPISWFCFIMVTSVWAELILDFPPYAGEQRLWVWVGHWHRDHTKAGQVHVWQPGKWRYQLCHPGGASDPAAGEHPLFHTAPYCWEIKLDWCVFGFFSSTCQEGAFALVFKSVHYPGEAVGTRYTHTNTHWSNAAGQLSTKVDWSCCWLMQMLPPHRRGSPLLMGVRSDHKLSTDHIPVLYRSSQFHFSASLSHSQWNLFPIRMQIEILFVVFFSAAKDKKSCGALSRTAQDTCLFPLDEKAVEYYFASDARSVFKQAPYSRGS